MKKTTVRQLLERYFREHPLEKSTEKSYVYSLNVFERWLGRVAIPVDLSDRLSDWVRDRSEVRRADGVRSQRAALVTILRFAADLGLASVPRKIRRVKLHDLEPTWFSDDELAALLRFADDWQRAAIHLVRSAGPRRGDVFRARWPQVGKDGVLRFVQAKPGERHSVQLSTQAIKACRQIRSEGSDLLFPCPWSKDRWHREWRRLGKRSNVDVYRRGLQAIRRSAASLVAREHGEDAAARFLGHSRASGVSVFRRYYSVGELVDRPAPSPPPFNF